MQAPTLPGQREHLDVSTADALADLVRLVEELDRVVEIAFGEHRRQCMDESQPAVLRGLGQIGEEPLGAREPTTRDRERAPPFVIPAQRERDAGSAQGILLGGIGGVRALAVRDRLLELSTPPGCLAVVLEIYGGEGLRTRPRRRRHRLRARPAVRPLHAHRRAEP